MPRKKVVVAKSPNPIVSFKMGSNTYQIDPQQRKVYRRFVEIETSRAAEIFSVWRARRASA